MRIYYGWIIVAISIVAYVLAIGATYSSFSIFVVPVSAELKLSRAEMNTAIILLSAGNAILAPFFGRMLDRFPARRIIIGGALLLGLSFFGLSVSKSAWLSSVIVALPLAAGYLAVGSLTMTVLIARWFVIQRGRAMALSSLGTSFATIGVPPVIGVLVENQGWRGTLMIVAGVITALLVMLAIFVRERPGPDDVEGAQLAASSALSPNNGRPLGTTPPTSVWELVKTSQFWTLGLGVGIVLGVLQALSISIVPLAIQGGLSMLQSTGLLSLFGTGAFVGMSLFAAVADKVDRLLMLILLSCTIAILNGVLLIGEGYIFLAIWSFSLGVASGPVAPAFFALLADRFGAASFGTVRGLMVPVMAIIGMSAIRLAGEVFDRTGGYDFMLLFFVGALLASALLLSLSGWGCARESAGEGAVRATAPDGA